MCLFSLVGVPAHAFYLNRQQAAALCFLWARHRLACTCTRYHDSMRLAGSVDFSIHYLASNMRKDKYAARFVKAIRNSKSTEEYSAIVNRIYEDGFRDGRDDTTCEHGRKEDENCSACLLLKRE